MEKNPLVEILDNANMNPVSLGSWVLVLPFGGRVLGLYPGENQNVLWVNPDIDRADNVGGFFADPDWINIGGHRIWISPEAETNVADIDNFWDTYDVPKTMDPAAYSITTRSNFTVTLSTTMDLMFHRLGERISLSVARRIALCTEPPVELPAGVSYAGYTSTTILETAADIPAAARPGIWSLVQVPGGGVIIAGTKAKVEPRVFFGDPEYQVEKSAVWCTVRTAKNSKIGLKASVCRGLMACLNVSVSPPTLLIAENEIGDESGYADYPADDPSDTGYAQQIYVDDGTLGGFGELEYHTPSAARNQRLVDSGSVWSFAGKEEDLRTIVKTLFGLEGDYV